jgi:hypothetical protein
VSHPLRLSLILIRFCVSSRMLILFFSHSWFFYLLILIFLGGVIILITYITSLAANEKSYSINFLSINRLGYIFLLFFLDESFAYERSSSLSLAKTLFEQESSGALIFCFIRLLIVLIRVIKLVKVETGPLIKRL